MDPLMLLLLVAVLLVVVGIAFVLFRRSQRRGSVLAAGAPKSGRRNR